MTATAAGPATDDRGRTRPRRRWWQVVLALARRAFWLEIRSYQSIYRWLFRRPRVPTGAVPFSYHQPVLAILIVLLVVSVVELVVVDLIVHRWASVRIPLLVVGLWGVVWMFGLLCGMICRPHAVGPEGIRVRSGSEIDLSVPWDDVHAVTRRKRVRKDKEPKITDDGAMRTLHLRIGEETTSEITLERPIEYRLPHGRETVERIALYVEDPGGFMDEVRRHIG